MNNPVSSRLYEALGRATWSIGKRKLRQRIVRTPSGRQMAIAVLALGVVGFGAIAARAGHSN